MVSPDPARAASSASSNASSAANGRTLPITGAAPPGRVPYPHGPRPGPSNEVGLAYAAGTFSAGSDLNWLGCARKLEHGPNLRIITSVTH